MCIRDSFWTLFGGTLSKDFQFKSAPSEQFTQEEIQGAADVALRRFKYGFSGCTMTKLQYVDAYASSDTWNWAAAYNADAVSYTHLDVYKRQMQAPAAAPKLSFSGTTATCSVIIRSGASSTDKISVTAKLWNGRTCLKTWTASGTGRVSLSKTATVSKGKTYKLTVDYTVNGVKQPQKSVTRTCS